MSKHNETRSTAPVVAGAQDPNAAKLAAHAAGVHAAALSKAAVPKVAKPRENYMRVTHPHDAERLMNLGLLNEQEIALFKKPVDQGGKGLLPPDPVVEEDIGDAPAETDEDVSPEVE
jgi:hypothetical protein